MIEKFNKNEKKKTILKKQYNKEGKKPGSDRSDKTGIVGV